ETTIVADTPPAPAWPSSRRLRPILIVPCKTPEKRLGIKNLSIVGLILSDQGRLNLPSSLKSSVKSDKLSKDRIFLENDLFSRTDPGLGKERATDPFSEDSGYLVAVPWQSSTGLQRESVGS